MKKLIFILVSLYLSISYSNIRVGRTGGGLAEMKAYSVVDQLDTVVKLCTTSVQRCGMKTWQSEDLKRLEATINLSKVELTAPWAGPSQFNNGALKINSFDLYVSNRPKRYGEILSLVLSLLLRDGLKVDSALASWPFQVFSNFQENMLSLNISNYGFVLHSLSLKMPRTNESVIQSLALEKENITEDLTAELVKGLGCPQAIWNVEGWNYSSLQSWVRAQLSWQCGRQEWYGELQLILSREGVSRLSIVRKTQVR